MPERDANQLAADDAAQMCSAGSDSFSAGQWCEAANVLAEDRARLVGLVGTLRQERDDALAALHPHSVAVVLKAARAEAAEAALAETNQAWAATGRKLATARQALTALVDWNERYPSHRIYGSDAIKRIAAEMDDICEFARRALAATEDTP